MRNIFTNEKDKYEYVDMNWNYEKYTHIPVSANAMFMYYSQKHHSDS